MSEPNKSAEDEIAQLREDWDQSVYSTDSAQEHQSDTPRTDEWKRQNNCATWPEVRINPFDFARQLERELNAANARVKELEGIADRLNLLLCCEFGYCDTEEWNTSSIAQRCKMVEGASGELDKLMRRAKP